MTKRLVVDVGMHRGEDAEAYLAAGYRVLSVEANPALVDDVRRRLAGPIAAGDLEVVHAAVVETAGDVTVYVGEKSGWGSVTADRAGAALGTGARPITVPGLPLPEIVGNQEPHYIKVDIEGADAAAIRSLAALEQPPEFVSWECDLLDTDETSALLDLLAGLGYQRFKLVNQATHADGNTSGPFGDDAPGDWSDLAAIRERYLAVARQQRTRARFGETGRVAGLPLGRLYPVLRWTYNAPPVAWARRRWAGARGVEVGGWFDIHAAR